MSKSNKATIPNGLDVLTGIFVGALLISNIASTKLIDFGIPSLIINLFGINIIIDFVFTGGTLLFLVTYIFGDVLTEVYGFKHTRRVIWTGFIMATVMSIVLFYTQVMPPAEFWNNNDMYGFPLQEAYNAILGPTFLIVVGSVVGYLIGSWLNSVIMSIMKKKQEGKQLWKRTIGSTLAGELVDTIVFVIIAFGLRGNMPLGAILGLIIVNYVFKVLVEVLMTPVTYKIVNWLKKVTGQDKYDYGVKYHIIGK